MTRTERLEIRLNEELINDVDQWRSQQSDVPNRSEAIRRLLSKSLSSSTSAADFELARFQIKSAALIPGVKNKIAHAHVFAWDRGIYPAFQHDEFAKPFAKHFKVSEEQLSELVAFLDEDWMNGKCHTFYELEDHLGIRYRTSDWTRSKLIDSMKYIFLTDGFDQIFWDTLLKPMRHPAEARYILNDFKPEEDLYFQ